MLENSTLEVKSTVNNGHNLIWLYVTWVCFFSTTALPNLIFTLTVIRYRALNTQKEYLIMAGLSFADFIEITAYSIAGLHRLSLIWTDQWNSKSSTWSCVTLVHNVIWWFSAPTSGLMLIIVSLDRFVSVAFPPKYFLMTERYAYRMLGIVYGFGVFMCLLSLVFTQTQESTAQLAAPCFTGATVLSVNKFYAASYMYVRSVTGMLSVVFYVGVGLMYWKKKQQKVGPKPDHNHRKIVEDRKRQRKLTKNLVLSCACTTIFLVVPSCVAFTAEKVYELPRWVLQFIWLLPPINPLFNVIIYYKRLPHLRKGMKALLTNKMMPPKLSLWSVVKI